MIVLSTGLVRRATFLFSFYSWVLSGATFHIQVKIPGSTAINLALNKCQTNTKTETSFYNRSVIPIKD